MKKILLVIILSCLFIASTAQTMESYNVVKNYDFDTDKWTTLTETANITVIFDGGPMKNQLNIYGLVENLKYTRITPWNVEVLEEGSNYMTCKVINDQMITIDVYRFATSVWFKVESINEFTGYFKIL